MDDIELRKARLKSANAHLEVRGFALKQHELAAKIGCHKTTISSAFNGNPRYLTNHFLKKFNAVYGNIFSLEWLIAGNGGMLQLNDDSDIEANASTEGIPYYNELFSCGSLGSGFGNTLSSTNPSGYINFPGIEPNADTFIVRAHGDSMINREDPAKSITDGTWVALRKLDKSNFRWGEVYAIATSNGYIIKRVTESQRDGYICCESFNTEDNYTPFEVATMDIVDIAQVIGTANFKRWA